MGHPVGGGEDGGGLGGVAVLVEGLDGSEPEPAEGQDQEDGEDGDDRAGHGQASAAAQAGSWPRCLRTAALCISPAW